MKHILFLKYWYVYFCWNLHIWFTWKFIIKKINLITHCLKIHGNTCELNFWSWHYHPIMGPIQNMEAMFQIFKKIILRKDLHMGLTSSFYCECTHQFAKLIFVRPKTKIVSKIKCTIFLEQLYYIHYNTKPKSASKGFTIMCFHPHKL